MNYREIKKVKHYIYDSLEEYESSVENAPKVLEDWREGNQGDWVWSDDGHIIQLLKVNAMTHPGDSPNYKASKGYCRTVVGTFINKPDSYMDTDFDNHPNRYTFSTKIKNTAKRVQDRDNLTNREREFAASIVAGKSAEIAFTQAFESNKNAKKKAALLLRQERVMKEIEKSVLDVAKEQGIDHNWILRRFKCLVENSEDEMVQLRALTELGKAVGTIGAATKQKEVGIVGMFQGFNQEDMPALVRPEVPAIEQKNEK